MKFVALEWEKANPGQSCQGLAAPQIGVNLRVIIMRKPDNNDDWFVLINPVYVGSEGGMVQEEGCLSLPDHTGRTARPETSVFYYYDMKNKRMPRDVDGRQQYAKVTGLTSQVLCHEMDHLNGVLFTDNAIKTWHPSQPEPADEKETLFERGVSDENVVIEKVNS